jgi:peptidoglycan/LPS O-acetylase OafA/YrhL
MGTMVEFHAWELDFSEADEFTGNGFLSSVSVTIHYAAIFIFGMVLASCRDRAAMLGGRHVLGFLAMAAVLMLMPSDTAKGIGSVLLIATAIGSDAVGSFLRWRPLRWLGRVSYSLYLIHFPIIMAFAYACGGRTTAGAAIAAIILSGIAAEIMYPAIEVPSTRLGRRLTSPRSGFPAPPSSTPLALVG